MERSIGMEGSWARECVVKSKGAEDRIGDWEPSV